MNNKVVYKFIMEEGEESCSFNVGGCVFSIPLNRLTYFQDSLLLKSASAHGDRSTLFIDRDGCTFRHVYSYISTGKLSSACALEVNILHELAADLHLTVLQQVGWKYFSVWITPTRFFFYPLYQNDM